MLSLFEFKIQELCNEHSKEELAELYLKEFNTRQKYMENNEELRKEIESLKLLIARGRR